MTPTKRPLEDIGEDSGPNAKRQAEESTASKGTTKPVHPFFAPRSKVAASSSSSTETTSTNANTSVKWKLHNNSVLHGTYSIDFLNAASQDKEGSVTFPLRIAGFDLDSTLIISGKPFSCDPIDWKFFHSEVVTKVRRLVDEEGYLFVIFSNQKNLISATGKKLENFKLKLQNIVKAIRRPVIILAAVKDDACRKPCVGMWEYLESTLSAITKQDSAVDRAKSFYVGDAAGRPNGWRQGAFKDFADSDLKFAINLGVEFHTPEEYFGGAPRYHKLDFQSPESEDALQANIEKKARLDLDHFNSCKYLHSLQKQYGENIMSPLFKPTTTPLIPRALTKPNASSTHLEVVLFVGPPSIGKTSFYQRFFKPYGYTHVNQDTLKTREKCLKAVREALTTEETSCVVDNTNRDIATRKLYIDLVQQIRKETADDNVKIGIRCLFFNADVGLAMHNNRFRAFCSHPLLRGTAARSLIPDIAFNGYFKSLEPPSVAEGFDEVKEIFFVPDFVLMDESGKPISDEERVELKRYWNMFYK